MESNTKHLLAVFSLMLGLAWGVPYIVSDEKNTSWLMLAIIFLALAVAFWFWIMRDKRTAEKAAEDAVDAAEENLKKLEAQAEDAADAGGAAIRQPDPSEIPTDEKDIQPSSAPSASMPSTSSEAEIEEALAAAVPVTEEASTEEEADAEDAETEDEAVAEEPLEERVEAEPVEALVEDAKDGDPVAESTLAEVTAAPPEPVTSVPVEVEVETEDEPEPVAETAPEPQIASDEPDDLTRIEGIGPKYAEILIGAGVDTFAKVAEMDEEAIVTLVRDNGGRKSASMATWAEQAKLAAAGDWDALEKLQDELSGGRR